MTTLKIELPAQERGRGPEEIKRFDRLKRKLDRADLKPSQREAAAAELAAQELGKKQETVEALPLFGGAA